MLHATGLVVGAGACLPWCSISCSFEDVWTTGLLVSGLLIPFLPEIGFQLLKSLWSSLTYFLFNDGPDVLYR